MSGRESKWEEANKKERMWEHKKMQAVESEREIERETERERYNKND